MAKVTSKLQVTIPKRVAAEFHIEPGDDVEWEPAGEVIRVIPSGRGRERLDVEERLRLFEQATVRQREREQGRPRPPGADRGWRREDLYDRGLPR
jgi:AbrB family looped-hinge helix DNA binding protein